MRADNRGLPSSMYVHNVGVALTFVRRDDRSLSVVCRIEGSVAAEGGRLQPSNVGATAVASC